MSIETQVVINGVFTTQRVDIQTAINMNIRANSRAQAQAQAPPTKNKAAPSIGVLTRTVMESPIIRWIIPARIRHEDKNDVVFIGDKLILIREVQSDGSLKDVASRRLSDARIQHARAFGVPRGPERSFSYPTTKVKDEDEEAMPTSHSNPFSPHQSEVSKQHGKAQMTVPPQILVLSLDTGSLLFVFAYECADGTVQFTASSRPLHRSLSELEEPGKRMAVDPKSQALAVAALERAFVLYALHPMPTFKDTIETQGSLKQKGLDFIREERLIHVDGEIIKMDFLYPSAGDEKLVILLLMVSKDDQTRFLLWEWDTSGSLDKAKQQGTHGLRVGDHDRKPSLLIPLTISGAFLLVSESTISAYTGILTGAVQRIFVGKMSLGTSGTDSKACTAWAKPVRHKNFKHDDIYIVRHDGHLRLIEIDQADQQLLKSTSPAGELGNCVGTAFATIDLGLRYKRDLVAAGGYMGTGGVYFIAPRFNAARHGVFPNWTPSFDFVVTPQTPRHGTPTVSSSIEAYKRDQVFACSGQLNYGAITELMYGMKAWIKIAYPYALGADRIWSFRGPPFPVETDPKGGYPRPQTLFIVSFMLNTEILRMLGDELAVEYLSEADTQAFNVGTRTLVAGKIGSVIVQVNSNRMSTMYWQAHDSIVPAGPQSMLPMDESIIEACLEPSSASIITVVQKQDQFLLVLTILLSESSGGIFYVIVGTTDSTLQFFEMDPEQGLRPTLEHSLNDKASTTEFAICEGVAVLQPCKVDENAEVKPVFLICGLRNGHVAILKVSSAIPLGNEMIITLQRLIPLGNVPAQVKPDALSSDSTFLICGDELYRLRVLDLEGNTRLCNVWLEDFDDLEDVINGLSTKRYPITVLTRISSQPPHEGPGLAGSLVGISANNLVVFDIDDEPPKAVARHMSVGATPKRMVYSPHLKSLVVASSSRKNNNNTLENRERGNTNDQAEVLSLFNLQSGDDSKSYRYEDKYSVKLPAITIDRGEEILVMINWIFTLGKDQYNYIVLGTGISSRRPGSSVGGRIYLIEVKITASQTTASQTTASQTTFRHRHVKECHDSVRSLSPIGACSLVSSAGTEICVRRLFNGSGREKKFEKTGAFILRSPGIHLTTDEPLIYVTTVSDSLTILRYQDSKLVQVFSDTAARLSKTHLTLPHHSLTLVSDNEACVMGLWQDREALTSCSGRRSLSGPLNHNDIASGAILFEAELPVIITRFQVGDVQPSWRPRKPPPGEIAPCGGSSTRMGVEKRSQEILGFGEDGSLYQFVLLSEAAWRLLRFIQNLGFRSSKLNALTPMRHAQTHIEPRDGEPHLKHVDGDVLACIVGFGSEFVRELLNAKPISTKPAKLPVDFATREARCERFKVLVTELLGNAVEDPVEAAMKYMEAMLQPIL
ncbi:MAG: hypothetical protein M1816_006328 [Peltula sp. TS41687]|nr:MAG: hypothetical protein M1816_006328 [Peltula sp. TS41687]